MMEGKMGEMIAFCGLACNECGAFLATSNDDDEKRQEVAGVWSKMFKADIKKEDINCDGCLSNSARLFSHCNVCEIRKCGREKGVSNCAHCDEYACSKLDWIFQMAPDSKNRLDEINASIV